MLFQSVLKTIVQGRIFGFWLMVKQMRLKQIIIFNYILAEQMLKNVASEAPYLPFTMQI